jgi:5-formyltetrahydrofolate cyclo-ligase
MPPGKGVQGSDALARAKAELRARIRAELSSLPPAERLRRGEAAALLLTGISELHRARTILAFLSFGGEIPTMPLIEALASSGPDRTLLVPYLETGEMHATPYLPGDPLSPSSYGPSEPARRKPVDPTEIDVVVVPGLAFDREGRRMGRGGGYYDSFLPRMRRDAVRIGLGYREQLLARVPEGPVDRRVDMVVTDREVVETNERGRGAAR